MESINVWGATLLNAMTTLGSKVAAFVPNMLASLAILVIGYLIARTVAAVLQRLLSVMRVDTFASRVGVRGLLDRANVSVDVSYVLSRLVFWLIMLMFLVSATESLGLPRVSATIDGFVFYLPKVLGAAVILLLGLYVAQLLREGVTRGAEGIGIDYARSLGTTAYGLIAVIVVTLAVGQLELETDILNQVIAIVLISIGAAAAIAFGFGSRSVAANILAGTYLRELYREGDRLEIAGNRGTVTRITPVKIELASDEGEQITIPNQAVLQATVKRKQ